MVCIVNLQATGEFLLADMMLADDAFRPIFDRLAPLICSKAEEADASGAFQLLASGGIRLQASDALFAKTITVHVRIAYPLASHGVPAHLVPTRFDRIKGKLPHNCLHDVASNPSDGGAWRALAAAAARRHVTIVQRWEAPAPGIAPGVWLDEVTAAADGTDHWRQVAPLALDVDVPGTVPLADIAFAPGAWIDEVTLAAVQHCMARAWPNSAICAVHPIIARLRIACDPGKDYFTNLRCAAQGEVFLFPYCDGVRRHVTSWCRATGFLTWYDSDGCNASTLVEKEDWAATLAKRCGGAFTEVR